MAHSEEHYRAAAHSLGEGFLGSQFGQSSLDDAAVSKVHRVAEFQENALLMSRDNGSIAGVLERGAQAAKSITEAKQRQSEKAKRSMDNVLFLNLLDQHIAGLEADIGEIRDYFSAKYGDAWAEEFALEVLDPDEMPQRQEGESLSDYRERVERAYIEEITDKNGNLKPEYRDHPEAEHLERLARKTRNLDAAKELKSEATVIAEAPNMTDAEKQEAIVELLDDADLEESFRFQIEFEEGSVQDLAARDAMDETKDEALRMTTASSSDNDFLM